MNNLVVASAFAMLIFMVVIFSFSRRRKPMSKLIKTLPLQIQKRKLMYLRRVTMNQTLTKKMKIKKETLFQKLPRRMK